MEEENLITLKDLCEYLKTTKPTVLKMIKDGLPHYKLSNDYRFKLSEINDRLKGVKN